MENKKTAVEWLVDQLPIRMKNYLMEDIVKAKEMEKLQMNKTWQDGLSFQSPYTNFEEYYNKNYGKETDRT